MWKCCGIFVSLSDSPTGAAQVLANPSFLNAAGISLFLV
jgi:hypothetical protein